MSVVEVEVFEPPQEIIVPQDKALKAAGALSKRDQKIYGLRAEMSTVKWMLATDLTLTLRMLGQLYLFTRH